MLPIRYEIPPFNLNDELFNIVVFDLLCPYPIGVWPRPLCEPFRWNNGKRVRFQYLRDIQRSKQHKPGSRRWLKWRRDALKRRARIEAMGYQLMVPIGYELDNPKQ